MFLFSGWLLSLLVLSVYLPKCFEHFYLLNLLLHCSVENSLSRYKKDCN
jgi:hypothetical protein